MAKQNQIEYKIRRLAEKHNIRIQPALHLTWDNNIKKYYRIKGSMDDRKNFIADSKVLGYLSDSRCWKIELAGAAAIFEPTIAETERLYKCNDIDVFDYLMMIIVRNYNFDEELYYIDSLYRLGEEKETNICEFFSVLLDFKNFIDYHVKREVEYASGYEEADLYKLAEWANRLLNIVGLENQYSAEKWIKES